MNLHNRTRIEDYTISQFVRRGMLPGGLFVCLMAAVAAAGDRYEGKYCAGAGDVEFLRLIDESFAFLHPNPVVPNVTMLYQPDWDTFEEGAGWGGWWIQNSYGFSYAATPFLQEPWFSTLQRSWDLFWDNQGDGKRMGLWGGRPQRQSPLVAPDGCLGDCAMPGASPTNKATATRRSTTGSTRPPRRAS